MGEKKAALRNGEEDFLKTQRAGEKRRRTNASASAAFRMKDRKMRARRGKMRIRAKDRACNGEGNRVSGNAYNLSRGAERTLEYDVPAL